MRPSKMAQRVQELRLVFGAQNFGHFKGRDAFVYRTMTMGIDGEDWEYTWRVRLPTRTLNAAQRAGLIERLPIGFGDHRGGRYRLTIAALLRARGLSDRHSRMGDLQAAPSAREIEQSTAINPIKPQEKRHDLPHVRKPFRRNV